MFTSWLRTLWHRPTEKTPLPKVRKRAHARAIRRSHHLRVEALEARAVPAVVLQSITPPASPVEATLVGGTVAQFTGTSTNANDYTATVSWGDSTPADTLTAASGGIIKNADGTFGVTDTHTYAEEGSKVFVVTVTDAGGANASASATIVVADALLTINYPNIVNGVPKTPLGASPIEIVTFTEANPNALITDFTATIAWGDGATDTATAALGTIIATPGVTGQWSILGNHTYATTGAYQVSVTLTDVGGGTASVVVPTIVAYPSPLQVTPYDPTTPLSTLTDALIKPGTGLNLVSSGSSFIGQNGQAGTYTGFSFHDQNSSLSLANGILLTSGSAVNALGPNNQTGATTAYGSFPPGDPLGDPQLDAIVSPDITFDANSLTLQFTTDPGVTSIQFQFVFGSEEFPEWVGQYNDIFAVFLDGQQITYDPTGKPITVNNNFFQLNNSGDITTPSTTGKTVVAYDIQYDGLTPALTTVAQLDPKVTTHELKFAIADTRDMVLDSGVFITSLAGNGSSGGTGTHKAPQANAGGPYTVEAGKKVQLNASGTTDDNQDPSKLTYLWDLNGNGKFGEIGPAATNGDEVGITPTFLTAGLKPGTDVTVSLQVTDSAGLTSTDQAVVHVIAPVMTINPLTAPSATEGQAMPTQTLATFTDANADPQALKAVVTWADGQSDTLTYAGGGIVQNADGSFSVKDSHTFAEEGQGLKLTVQVTDINGTTISASTTMNVADPGVVATGGLTLATNPGAALTGVTVATFVDPAGAEPNIADPTGVHYTADITWGDGGSSSGQVVYDSVAKVFKVLGDHTYQLSGNYPITVTIHHELAPDAQAISSASVTATATAFIGQGPRDAQTLLVYGTPGDDVISVVPAAHEGDVRVIINGVSKGVFAKGTFASIAMYGGAGNDILSVAEEVNYPALLFGGPGNDVLIGGGGPSYLDGGIGNDVLIAGEGPSILIGGGGADVLIAGDSNALLIPGVTDFEDPATTAANQAVSKLFSLWTATTPKYADRVAAVQAFLAGHVSNDGQKDLVIGGAGQNLFFVSTGDVVLGKKKSDIEVMV